MTGNDKPKLTHCSANPFADQ